MFGVIISGRPVLTAFDTISPTQAQMTIPSTPAFGHIVVFMLPGATLPEGQSAAIYLRIPPVTDFKLWGELSTAKQSAIFKIRDSASNGGRGGGIGAVDDDAMVDEDTISSTGSGGAGLDAAAGVTIGISIEPSAQVLAALAAQKNISSPSAPSTAGQLVRRGAVVVPTKILAQRIIANAFNFLASFSSGGAGGNEVVPLKSFQEWWRKFEKRIELDPGFLEKDGV